MPSSGYGMVNLGLQPEDPANAAQCRAANEATRIVIDSAATALAAGLFIEWLECFLAAWEKTSDASIAAQAGIIEWDL